MAELKKSHTLKKSNYKKVAVGGSFDILHKGHEKLLKTSLKIGEKVVIGLSTDELVKNLYKNHRVSSFQKRREELLKFIKKNSVLNKCDIIPIYDRNGTATDDSELEAIVVSEETLKTADQINKIRSEKGLHPLEIILVETIYADDGKPISSTRIRNREINQEGKILTKN